MNTHTLKPVNSIDLVDSTNPNEDGSMQYYTR